MIRLKHMSSRARRSLSISPVKYDRLTIALVALIILSVPGFLKAQDTDKSDQWQFSVEPYLWMSAIDGSKRNDADFNVNFNEILDNLKFSFMGTAGVKKGKWSFIVDTVYMDVKDTKSSRFDVSNGTINASTEVKVKSWVVTPVIGYNLIECERGKLDIVIGARYLRVQVDINVNIAEAYRSFDPQVSDSEDIWDGILGLKSEIALYERLYMPIYIDIGTGDTDLTCQVIGGLGYRFSACDVVAGYRYMSWDFSSSSPVDHMNLSGPFVGLKFIF